MGARLVVYSEGESFHDYWHGVAEDVGLDLVWGRDMSAAAGSALLAISCPGVEEKGPDLVRDARGVTMRAPVVVGAEPSHRLAVEVVRAGADDYFVLPEESDRLRDYVQEQARLMEGSRAGARLAALEREGFDFSKIVGESDAMREALDRAARIIPRGSATVLLTGETGTGKELLAQAIHYNGPRGNGPFVELNCTAVPANLLESELFGHERGAFTDARRAKPGLFEVADGGTLFLDEVGHMPWELQGKLLKVLEDKRIRRVGGTRTQDVDVRILAATNVDLAGAVRDGTFREDLYYRLSVIPIHLPPLRERGDDVLLLAHHFLDSLSDHHGIPRPDLTPQLQDRLAAHFWPGNVRELRNAIERALLLGGGALRPEDLFPEEAPVVSSQGSPALPFPAPLETIEQAAIRRTLELCEGNKSAAARRLGISRSKLHRALKQMEEGE